MIIYELEFKKIPKKHAIKSNKYIHADNKRRKIAMDIIS